MDAHGTLSHSQPREVIFIHGIHFDTLGSFKKKISWFSWYEKWQVVKDYLARLGTIYDMQWFMKKSLENRLGIAVWFEKTTISSIVRNFPNRSRENAKFRILNNNHTELPTFGGRHPSKLGDIYLPGTFWGWITMLTGITRYQNIQFIRDMQSITVWPKRLLSTLQPRLSASSFNSLIDLSFE